MTSRSELPPDPATSARSSTTRGSGNYDLIVVLFCGMLLISNIGATKLIQFGPIITDGGAFLFPLTYIFGDVLSESTASAGPAGRSSWVSDCRSWRP